MSRDLNFVTPLLFRYVRADRGKGYLTSRSIINVAEDEDEEAASSESREREIRLILDSFSRPFVAPPRFPVANFALHWRR